MKLFNYLFVLTFIFKFYSPALSQAQSADTRLVNPLYDLRVSNISTGSSAMGGSSALFFDIYIYHTNLPDSGPFEFSAGQYNFNFNPGVAHGGELTYSIVPNSSEFTNPDAIPVNPTIEGNILRLDRNPNLGAGNGPIVSSEYPGTRVVTMKLETTAPSIDHFELNLRWRDSTDGEPYTRTFAYIDTTSTEITDNGTFIIDEEPLPVELTSFTAKLNRNNVVLNWSTAVETNNSGFDIERANSTGQWSTIGFIRGNGTTTSPNNYVFEDRNLSSGKYNYRLKQIDYNGIYEYYNLTNEVGVGVPNAFSLRQNYPNPFNPATKIDFDIAGDGFVSLRLYDMNGKEIKTLINEFRNSGYYSLELDASDLPSGAYFYRLESGNFLSTKKLVVLK